MQNVFSKHKRKHGHDREDSEERSRNKKHKDIPEYESNSSAIEREVLDSPPRETYLSGKPKLSKQEKLANLLKALDDTLEEDGMDETLGLMGDEAFNRCLDLRKSLRKRKPTIDPINTHPASQSKSPDQSNVPKSMSGFSLTPWVSSNVPKSLPPLPAVFDPTLEAAAFIHQGATNGNVHDLNYERLEWVGDAYLYLTATLLISQTFPSLLPGKSSQLRERLVKNVTLAGYARQYGFEKRAILPDSHVEVGKQHSSRESERIKIFGDIFEAYIAAVVLSDPVDGVARCSAWLKGLWGMTLKKEIMAQEEEGIKIDSPLWRLRGTAVPIKILASKEERRLNSKDKLRNLICVKGITLTYKDAAPEKKDPATKLPLFTVGVYLDGWGEKEKQLGFGTAHGKKDAGTKAAEMAMANGKLIKVYVEKKRLYDAQVELERQISE